MLMSSREGSSLAALLLVACGSGHGSSAEHAPSRNVADEEDSAALDRGYAPQWNVSPLNGVLVPVPIDEMERLELEHVGGAVTGRMRFGGRIVALSSRQSDALDALDEVTGPATIAVHSDARQAGRSSSFSSFRREESAEAKTGPSVWPL